MRPELHLLLLLSLSSSLILSAALCVPRNSSISRSSSSTHPPPTTTSTPPISPPTTTTTLNTFPTTTTTTNTITRGVATSLAKSLCGRTDFPGVCISTVTPLITSFTGFLDAKSLLSLTLKAMPSKVKSVQAAALKLQEETKSDKGTSDSYKLAVELLGDALDEIDAATAAFAAGDKASVGVRASGLSDYFDDIDNEFMELDEPSPIGDDVHELWQMSANCLALTDFAYKKS